MGEHHRLKGVYPGRTPQSPITHVGHDHHADEQAAGPLGYLSLGDLTQRQATGHDADEEVGNQQGDEDDEENGADGIGIPSLPEVLHLGDEAVTLAQRPDTGADEEENAGNDEGGDRRHQSEDTDTGVIGFAGGTENGEGRHVGPEERHEQQEGTDGPAGDEVVLPRTTEQSMAGETDEEDHRQIDGDDAENHEGSVSGVSASHTSRCVGHARVTSRYRVSDAAKQKPM